MFSGYRYFTIEPKDFSSYQNEDELEHAVSNELVVCNALHQFYFYLGFPLQIFMIHRDSRVRGRLFL